MTLSKQSDGFLRRVLVADGTISGATGLMMAAAAPLLEDFLNLPATLLRVAGIALIPFAAFLIYLYRQAALTRATVGGVIALNLLWVAASVLLLFTNWVRPNALGIAFILFQAAVVFVLAELQHVGLRRMAAA